MPNCLDAALIDSSGSADLIQSRRSSAKRRIVIPERHKFVNAADAEHVYKSVTSRARFTFLETPRYAGEVSVPQRFGDMLTWLLTTEQSMPLAEFARRVEYSRSAISQICHSKRTPPIDTIEEWARQLELTGDRRDLFIELALLEHCPEQLRRMYYRQKAAISSLERRVTTLEAGDEKRYE